MNLSGLSPYSTTAAHWWKNEYKSILALLEPAVIAAHPFDPTATANLGKVTASAETVHINACRARAFDIARAWLPCATLTNLSWTTSFRNAARVTTELLASPINEVRALAIKLRDHLTANWPSGIVPFTERELETAAWLQTLGEYTQPHTAFLTNERIVEINYEMPKSARSNLVAVNARPKGAPLPVQLASSFKFYVSGLIDYASWRDLQRHRKNIGVSPLPKPAAFHPWYLEQVKNYLTESQAAHIIKRAAESEVAVTSHHDIPMGVLVPFHYELDLGQAIYFAELRSGQTTHATLRPVAQELARQLERMYIKVHADYTESKFDVRRGKQTIFEQPETTSI
jgi:hypothetical protein